MGQPLVVVLHFGRAGAIGALRRVASISGIFEAAGARVLPINLRNEHPAAPSDVTRSEVLAVLRSEAVPESLSWSVHDVVERLDDLRPDVTICNSMRAYHPALLSSSGRLIVDFVDRLSISYQDRAAILHNRPSGVGFRLLARSAARFERRPLPGVKRIASGWDEARTLHATWVPNTVDHVVDLVRPPGGPTHDLLFFGSLAYPPNVEAVDRLALLWPSLLARRPDLTVLVAGARPLPEVREAARLPGWTLLADFDRLEDVVAQCRLAVVPLLHTSGIQSKVLEAAALGIAQVVDSAAMRGFAPGFPAAVTDGDDDFMSTVIDLLDDEDRCDSLAAAAKAHVSEHYLDAAWSSWAAEVLDGRNLARHPPMVR